MTKEELEDLYPDGKVFPNQYEMGQFLHEYGHRNKVSTISKTWAVPIPDKDNYYDIAELSLSKGVSFFNDGCYIIEDLKDIDKYLA